MILNWPQITILLLSVSGLVITTIKHGQSPATTHNGWLMILACAAIAWIQSNGGFYNTMSWPQFVMIVYFGVAGGVSFANHGKPQSNYNIFKSIPFSIVYHTALVHGGFYGVDLLK